MSAQGGVPVLILKEGTGRTTGKEAQRNNITAAKIVAETVRTTLGPRGMDKMLVSTIGDVTITNDGATIMKELDVQHPAAKMLVEVSKTQDNCQRMRGTRRQNSSVIKNHNYPMSSDARIVSERKTG